MIEEFVSVGPYCLPRTWREPVKTLSSVVSFCGDDPALKWRRSSSHTRLRIPGLTDAAWMQRVWSEQALLQAALLSNGVVRVGLPAEVVQTILDLAFGVVKCNFIDPSWCYEESVVLPQFEAPCDWTRFSRAGEWVCLKNEYESFLRHWRPEDRNQVLKTMCGEYQAVWVTREGQELSQWFALLRQYGCFAQDGLMQYKGARQSMYLASYQYGDDEGRVGSGLWNMMFQKVKRCRHGHQLWKILSLECPFPGGFYRQQPDLKRGEIQCGTAVVDLWSRLWLEEHGEVTCNCCFSGRSMESVVEKCRLVESLYAGHVMEGITVPWCRLADARNKTGGYWLPRDSIESMWVWQEVESPVRTNIWPGLGRT